MVSDTPEKRSTQSSRLDPYIDDAALGTPNMLGSRLARTVEAITRGLEGESQPEKYRPLREFLASLLDRVTDPEAGATSPTREELIGIASDPETARAALSCLQRLQKTLVHSTLAYVSAETDTSIEVERMFKVLRGVEGELLSRIMEAGPRREAKMLAEVFHDLRSPITSVMFLSDALYSGQSGALSETQREQMRIIYSVSLTLLTLVENVLSSRNLAAGDVKPEFIPFSLGATLDEVERITRPMADQLGLELKFDWSCHGSRVGDPDVLRRILLNLVTNAISYTDEGAVRVDVREEDNSLIVEVKDTGPGMSEAAQTEIFTPPPVGAESERRGASRFSQSGLGLSIVQRLAHLVGGDVEVESEEGQGSRFEVRLPFPAHQ